MLPNRIKDYLDQQGVPFHSTIHDRAMTAQGTAASTHIPGRRFGKTVLLKHDGNYVLYVLPASELVDLRAVAEVLGGPVELAREDEVERMFPDCECGAMPPLGGLYGLPVVADACLAGERTIAVNGGTHSDVIEFHWKDYERTEHPRMLTH